MASIRGASDKTATRVMLPDNPTQRTRDYVIGRNLVTVDTRHFNALDYSAAQDAAIILMMQDPAGERTENAFPFHRMKQSVAKRVLSPAAISTTSTPGIEDEVPLEHVSNSPEASYSEGLQFASTSTIGSSQMKPPDESYMVKFNTSATSPLQSLKAEPEIETAESYRIQSQDLPAMIGNATLCYSTPWKSPPKVHARPARKAHRRRRPEDLTINGTAKLNVHADNVYGMSEYLSAGKWFQLMCDKAPSTIERVRPPAEPRRLRSGKRL